MVGNEFSSNAREKLFLHFQKLDPVGVGLVRIAEVQSLLLSLGGVSSAVVLKLIGESGVGLVRYADFLDWVFDSGCLALAKGESTEVSALKARVGGQNGSPTMRLKAEVSALKTRVAELEEEKDRAAFRAPAMVDSAEMSALKARVSELEAREMTWAKKIETETDLGKKEPELVSKKETREEEPMSPGLSAEMQYDDAVEQIGGYQAIRACRLQSIQIGSLVQTRQGMEPWQQDPVYMGLDHNVLMQHAELVQDQFAVACLKLGQVLHDAELQNTLHIGPRKGIVRAETKINVKYGGDVCQLSDITRATLQIKARGEETIMDTYKAMLQMLTSPPEGVIFLHFDDRFLRRMEGGYRDFMFLLSVHGILCELQINYDIILQIKEGEGHEEYEVLRLSNDLMMDAALKNDASSVSQHLRKGANPNYKTARQFYALSYAALHGNEIMAKALIDGKADPFVVDSTGSLSVRRALALGKFPAAQVLVSAMKKQVVESTTPLVFSEAAQLDIISTWSFIHQSLKNTRDKERKELSNILNDLQTVFEYVFGGLNAAFAIAAKAGLAKACERMLQAGAPANAYFFGSDVMADRFPVDLAIEGGSASVVQTLKAKGGRANIYRFNDAEVDPTKYAPSALKKIQASIPNKRTIEKFRALRNNFYNHALKNDMAKQMDALIEANHDEPWAVDLPNLLLEASQSGAARIARVALRRGAPADRLQPKQVAELVCRGVHNDDLELVTFLVLQRATFKECAAAAHRAAKSGQVGMIKLLAEGGCPLEEPDEKGELPVHMAARASHSKIVGVLHDFGCCLTARGVLGMTPAHLAAEQGCTKTLRVLYDLGCDLASDREEKGRYLLHTAVAANQAASIAFLLKLGCDANCRDDNGGTPVHHAAHGRSLDAIRVLAAGSADLNAKYPDDSLEGKGSRQGFTALHLACKRRENVLQLLLQLRADPTVKNAAGQVPLDLVDCDHARSILLGQNEPRKSSCDDKQSPSEQRSSEQRLSTPM
eukprot:gnl/MRDRNA2_/MRDRNA2_69912_c0_seq1.p1 gnl/MRDRNA2_/MRDRNA2_69912_c0~~gnl/MRDRNA2_/MRDRNA2_69912_c0_seq1.p1  ORF type:complete len:1000 (-),score=196.01 gnl/MRDRNA2_/MRDRNA2_69912_c0_seq1:94-3093(-)